MPDDKLSLDIGKNGQNVRLAAKITGWKIDVKSESAAKALEKETTLAVETTEDAGDAGDLFTDLDV